jgi:hypothetical protein
MGVFRFNYKLIFNVPEFWGLTFKFSGLIMIDELEDDKVTMEFDFIPWYS